MWLAESLTYSALRSMVYITDIVVSRTSPLHERFGYFASHKLPLGESR